MDCPRKPDIIVRKCLKCDIEFKSKGIGNRLCKKCNIENFRVSKVTEFRVHENGYRVIKKATGFK